MGDIRRIHCEVCGKLFTSLGPGRFCSRACKNASPSGQDEADSAALRELWRSFLRGKPGRRLTAAALRRSGGVCRGCVWGSTGVCLMPGCNGTGRDRL